MRLFLVGYMASGKTTYGKVIAQNRGIDFIDLDDFIVQQQGVSIAHIFKQFGEDKFREIEHNALKNIVKTTHNAIIATGGGAPCFYNNMNLMNKYGTTVYLQASEEWLVNSIIQHKGDRPLVDNLSQTELLAFVKQHLQTRKKYYLQAKNIVNVELITENNLLNALKKVLAAN